MMFGAASCDGGKKEDEKAPAKAETKDGKAEAKAKDTKAKTEDADIAIGKDGKAQPLGVPGM